MSFKKEITKRINTSILRNIPCEYNEANLSLVFSIGNGYKEVYKYYHQVRSFIYTTFYLLKNAGSVTELCIKTKEEFRLFLELKRLYNEISIEGHNIIGAESGVKAFNLEGINIVVNHKGIMSIAEETVIKVSKADFIRKPIKSIKELLRK